MFTVVGVLGTLCRINFKLKILLLAVCGQFCAKITFISGYPRFFLYMYKLK